MHLEDGSFRGTSLPRRKWILSTKGRELGLPFVGELANGHRRQAWLCRFLHDVCESFVRLSLRSFVSGRVSSILTCVLRYPDFELLQQSFLIPERSVPFRDALLAPQGGERPPFPFGGVLCFFFLFHAYRWCHLWEYYSIIFVRLRVVFLVHGNP